MKHKAVVFGLVVLVALICLSCRGSKGGASTGELLAQVNKHNITTDDFVISLDLLYPPEERPRYATPEGKELFLQQLIIMELFYQEGVAQGIEDDPRFKQVVENYKRYLVYNTLMSRGVNSTAIADYFKTHFAHVAIIFLKKPEKATDAQKEQIKARAQKLRDEIAHGADFAQVAKKNSEHESAKNGGDLGAITREPKWDNEMVDVAMALTEKEPLSQVVESPNGFYIVRLFQPVGKVDLTMMNPVVRRSIFVFMLRQNYATYAAQLQSQANVQKRPEALQNIHFESMPGPEGTPVQVLPPEGVPGVDSRAGR